MKKLLFILPILLFISNHAKAGGDEKLKAIDKHEKAVHIKDGWIRDPYIVLGPDDYYYLTGTTRLPKDPKEQTDYYNTGLGEKSAVGYKMQVWRSKDLIDWEYLDSPFSLKETPLFKDSVQVDWSKQRLWAPELHWVGNRWLMVYCPKFVSGLALTNGPEIKAPWTNHNPKTFLDKHDPSFFMDDNGQSYLLWGFHKFYIRPLKKDFSGFSGPATQITPANRKMGHEGTTMLKFGKKYVYIGTAWSTDKGRKGSYNLYYCTSDSPTGPFSERRFLGRFLGHGTPFKDKNGNWWCTAFYNADTKPLDSKNIQKRDLSDNAYTINQQGTTIVPLEIKLQLNGDVYIQAKDPHYAVPGPDEVQKFQKSVR
ncbi:family 43 glycosylhydrolase [Bacteroides sp. 51]|uniref:family 43 glycosylhydrolase n=1 Tax=Bacteroides sp. 51 TaxID=2302938 RepID=UPI0013D8A980|nr:family 43 glycosylhydrolase [Bacteroides sp. 51]NDV81740.1 beta-xylosidase [Bacteroides sp. 51]